jgi:hypothetical protein
VIVAVADSAGSKAATAVTVALAGAGSNSGAV